jgi:phosphatidylserine synthase 2
VGKKEKHNDLTLLLSFSCSYSNTERLGVHAWLFICNIMTESLICLKFSENEFTVPAPMFVKVAWSIILSFLLVIFPFWRFVIYPKKSSAIEGKDE